MGSIVTTVRRGFRFRLRTAAILMTLVGCFLAWIAKERRQSEYELLVANSIEEDGASVEMAGVFESFEMFDTGDEQGWWRDVAGKVLGLRIRLVHWQMGKFFGQPDLTKLAGLSKLQVLMVRSHWLTDLAPLSEHTELRKLGLADCPVTDLAPLSEHINLRELELEYCSVSDLSPLASLANLRRLVLYSSNVSDLGPLSSLTNLRSMELDVDPALVDDKQIESLRLALPDCQITVLPF